MKDYNVIFVQLNCLEIIIKNLFSHIVCLIFFLTFLSINILAFGNGISFERLSIEEGLSQSIVIDIFEDHNGFLWIGTQDGLNKYDGYKFTHFKYDFNSKNCISDNYITAIFEDNNSILWIGTNGGGINKYNTITEKFEVIKLENSTSNYSDDFITCLEIDTSGNMWVGTINNGITVFNQKDNSIKKINNSSGDFPLLPSNYITTINYCKDGNFVWIGTTEGLVIYEIDSERIFDVNRYIFNGKEPNKRIRSLLVTKESDIWIGTDTDGLKIISRFVLPTMLSKVKVSNYKHNSDDPTSISGNSINSIIEKSNGEIWIGIWGGGICKVNKEQLTEKLSFTNYRHSDSNPNSLAENDIICIKEDKSGVIWIGTYGGGLSKLNPHSKNFKHYNHNPAIANSLSNNRVFSLYQKSDSILWIGTWGGLNKFNTTTKKFSCFTNHKNNLQSISDNRITAITEDNNGELWIGTLEMGLNKLNKDQKSFTHYKHNPDDASSICNNRILSLFTASDNKIWIGTLDNGICYYSHSDKKFHRPELLNGLKKNIYNSRVKCLFEDNNKNILIGTYEGLFKYNPSDKTLENISNQIRNNSHLLKSRITSLNQTSDGSYWIGTFGKGLVKLTKGQKGYIAKQYTRANGLPNDFIYTVQIDNNNQIWISTNNGIAKLNTKSEYISTYTGFEGLQLIEFKDGAYYNRKNDQMFMGGIDGFVQFSPSNLTVDYKNSNIVFTELRIYNKIISPQKDEALQKSITETNDLVLTYDESSFSIDFAALNYISPKSISYSYILEGFDEEPTFVNYKNRTASYTNLPDGTYTLKVNAFLNSQNSQGYSKELKITITPPFWELLWFRLLTLLLLAIIIVGAIRWRTFRIRKLNTELEQEVKQRTVELEDMNKTKDRFFSIIAHDLKGPFSYLLNNSEFLAKEIDSLEKTDVNELASNINISANNVYNLLENLLQWSKLQMMGIEPNYQTFMLNEVINNNIGLIAPLASKKLIKIIKKMSANIVVNSDLDILNTVIRNLLTNAIKYTKQNGSITISAVRNPQSFAIIVTDTGIGMSKEQIDHIFAQTGVRSQQGTQNEKGTGMGLVLCIDFINVIGGKISIESKENIGTKVKCVFPLQFSKPK